MIEVKLPKDIANFRPKHVFNLTLREFTFGLIGLVAMLYYYLMGRYVYKWNMEPTHPTSWLIFGAGGFIIAIGFFRWHNMSLEQIIIQGIKYLLTPRKRLYHNNNDLLEVMNYGETKTQRDYIKTQERQNIYTKKSSNNATLPPDAV